MPYVRTIAIDGPAGCGKSTLGHRLAEAMGYSFLDTGMLYRAITRHLMNMGVKLHEPEEVKGYAKTLNLSLTRVQPRLQFEVNGRKIRKLNTRQIDKVVPVIAAYPFVREKVRETQRALAAQGNFILAGRDIGTVVLPDAELKIYLDVSLEERALRRHAQQNADGLALDAIRQDLLLRDLADSTRETSPMTVADDAVIINTDGLEVDAVVALVLQHALIEIELEQ
jgi:cytidylate kinase